jgi:hypothetical protein
VEVDGAAGRAIDGRWSLVVGKKQKMANEKSATSVGWLLPACFLAASVPIEVVYSWGGGLTSPYFLVKLAGWVLLAAGVALLGRRRPGIGLAFLAAGWGWLAANFWRAAADRVSQGLSFGSVEVWFTGGCFLVSLVGLALSLRAAGRR